MNARRLVIAIVLVLLAVLVLWVAVRLTHPVSTANLHLHVASLPPDDTALEQWLTAQPAVMKSSVGRTSDGLMINIKIHGRDADSFVSTIMTECRRRGYQINGYDVSTNSNPFQ